MAGKKGGEGTKGDEGMKRWMVVLLLVVWCIGYGMGYLLSHHLAFRDGYDFCTVELNNLLKEGLRYGKDFWITGIDVKFSPRRDGMINVWRYEKWQQ